MVFVVHNVENISIPKPLDVGMGHGHQDVVPPGSPLDGIVFLLKKGNSYQRK